jgi:hypothetical protein
MNLVQQINDLTKRVNCLECCNKNKNSGSLSGKSLMDLLNKRDLNYSLYYAINQTFDDNGNSIDYDVAGDGQLHFTLPEDGYLYLEGNTQRRSDGLFYYDGLNNIHIYFMEPTYTGIIQDHHYIPSGRITNVMSSGGYYIRTYGPFPKDTEIYISVNLNLASYDLDGNWIDQSAYAYVSFDCYLIPLK